MIKRLAKRLVAGILFLVFTFQADAQRTDLTVTTAPGGFPTSGTLLTMSGADTASLNSASLSGNGKEILVAHNTDGAVTYAVTITSIADPETGRTGDINSETLTFGQIKMYGPLTLRGWRQTSGKLHFEANNIAIQFGIIRLP